LQPVIDVRLGLVELGVVDDDDTREPVLLRAGDEANVEEVPDDPRPGVALERLGRAEAGKFVSTRVGSSSGPLVHLLDVRRVSTDDVNLFADVLEGLRDGLPPPSPVLDKLREDLEESSHDVKEERDEVKKIRDDVKESRDDVKKSSHDVKESLHVGLQLKSGRSELRAVGKRLLHHRQEGRAHVEGRLA
jgi:hypothetical protein